MDKQTLDAFRERRSDAYWAWVNGDEAGGLLEAAYYEAKRMHELAQDTYDAARQQEQDNGHRNS